MRKHLRVALAGLFTGAVFVGSVWAGAGLTPLTGSGDEVTRVDVPRAGLAEPGVAAPASLATGELLAGASAISLKPRPEDFGGTWVQDRDECLPVSAEGVDPMAGLAHVADWHTPWIENNNCIYMGGYGIGPSNPVVEWDDEYDLWVRSTALTDAEGDTLVLTLLDAEGYFADYNNLCGPVEPRCGSQEIADDLATELSLDPDGIIVASTHSHTSLDLIGGWGGVPAWYMDQVATSIKDSIREALDNQVPATLEGGETLARPYNGERRGGYRSAEDPTINWIRAVDGNGEAVATVAAYAAHPVSYDEGLGIGHGDFPPVFAANVEAEFGGVASVFQAGLGNMSPRGGWQGGGEGLAALIPPLGAGTTVSDPNIRVERAFWDQPVTNGPLGTLGAGGFFDRPFSGPATVDAGRQQVNRCRSASAVSAHVSVTAAKIGSVVVTAAPGETFANFSNTIEERSPITALAFGQANDALGYMPQSVESHHLSRQGGGFVDDDYFFDYEDAYSIDACFGDMALETTISLLDGLPAS
ncbi:MAG TPA: hypothetical protein VGB83_09555 [Actinomycetota bacterium]